MGFAGVIRPPELGLLAVPLSYKGYQTVQFQIRHKLFEHPRAADVVVCAHPVDAENYLAGVSIGEVPQHVDGRNCPAVIRYAKIVFSTCRRNAD